MENSSWMSLCFHYWHSEQYSCPQVRKNGSQKSPKGSNIVSKCTAYVIQLNVLSHGLTPYFYLARTNSPFHAFWNPERPERLPHVVTVPDCYCSQTHTAEKAEWRCAVSKWGGPSSKLKAKWNYNISIRKSRFSARMPQERLLVALLQKFICNVFLLKP